MVLYQYDYSVVGGDLRSVYMSEHLKEKGYRIIEYGLDRQGGAPSAGITKAGSLAEAAANAESIIAPIPFCRDPKRITGRPEDTDLTIEILKDHLKGGMCLFAGCIPEDMRNYCRRNSVFFYDFMENEELAIFNSIATAEGAIAEAVLRHPGNLHGSFCIVTGFGKCGKTLANKLSALSCRVIVCARSGSARAEASALGFETLDLGFLKEKLGRADFIFNTVPQLILSRELLALVKCDVLILDIASAPGGIDYRAAEEMKLHAFLTPGLPGKYSPAASAAAMVELVVKSRKDSYGIKK